MVFVPLSHRVLRRLRARGYNVLKSVSVWGDESPTYRPSRIEGSILEYLLKMELQGKITDNQHFLVIEEAIDMPENQPFGYVWNE